jgi:hypothetical protein
VFDWMLDLYASVDPIVVGKLVVRLSTDDRLKV